jgi:hypothetical protein
MFSSDNNLATFGTVQTADKIKNCGFSGAGGSHQRKKFTFGNGEIKVLENFYPLPAATIRFCDLM